MDLQFSRVLSVFDPEDDHLSPEANSQIKLHRILSVLGVLVFPVFGLLVPITNPTAADPMWARLGIGGLFAGLLAASYISEWIRKNYVLWMRGVLYAVVTWVVVVGVGNGFAGTYEVGLLLVYAALVAVMGIGARTMRPVVLFSAYSLLILGVGATVGMSDGPNAQILVARVATVTLVEGFIILAWLSTQNELRAREKLLRNVTENISEGVYRSTPEDGLIYANEALAAMFGYESVEEVLDADPTTFFADPEDRERLQAKSKREGGFNGLEVELRRKDGSTFTGLLSATLVRGEDGTVKCNDGAVIDITEQKERERMLRARDRQLEQIRENVTEVIWMSPADKSKLEFVSEAYEDIWGRSMEHLKNDAEVVVQAIHPEDRERVRSALAAQKERPEAYEETYRVVQPDGEVRWVQDRAAGVYDDHGELERIVGVATDITERRRMEGRLMERREKVEAIYSATNCLLTVEEPEAVLNSILEVLRRVFDYPVCGSAFVEDGMVVPHAVRTDEEYDLPLPGSYSEETDSIGARVHRAGEPVVIEDVGTLHNEIDYGDVRSMAGIPIGNHGVVFIGRAEHENFDAFDLRLIEILAANAAIILDRIDGEKALRAARREAERSDRSKSVFLANMSHEIRTPLTSVIGFAEAIGQEMEDDETGPVPRFASLIERSGRRLLETLNGVLTLSKLEAGSMELSPTPIDLAEEAEEIVELFNPQAEDAGVNLQMDLGEGSLWAQVDRDGLRMVLRNLVSNAVKYTEAGGDVTVRVGRKERAAVVEVEDTGIGMNPDEVSGLFEVFRQESEGLGREYQGSGLGLAVTREVIRQMEGSIEVETEKGEGSCFLVQFPLAKNVDSDSSHPVEPTTV